MKEKSSQHNKSHSLNLKKSSNKEASANNSNFVHLNSPNTYVKNSPSCSPIGNQIKNLYESFRDEFDLDPIQIAQATVNAISNSNANLNKRNSTHNVMQNVYNNNIILFPEISLNSIKKPKHSSKVVKFKKDSSNNGQHKGKQKSKFSQTQNLSNSVNINHCCDCNGAISLNNTNKKIENFSEGDVNYSNRSSNSIDYSSKLANFNLNYDQLINSIKNKQCFMNVLEDDKDTQQKINLNSNYIKQKLKEEKENLLKFNIKRNSINTCNNTKSNQDSLNKITYINNKYGTDKNILNREVDEKSILKDANQINISKKKTNPPNSSLSTKHVIKFNEPASKKQKKKNENKLSDPKLPESSIINIKNINISNKFNCNHHDSNMVKIIPQNKKQKLLSTKEIHKLKPFKIDRKIELLDREEGVEKHDSFNNEESLNNNSLRQSSNPKSKQQSINIQHFRRKTPVFGSCSTPKKQNLIGVEYENNIIQTNKLLEFSFCQNGLNMHNYEEENLGYKIINQEKVDYLSENEFEKDNEIKDFDIDDLNLSKYNSLNDNFTSFSKFYDQEVYRKLSLLPKKDFCHPHSEISLDDEIYNDILHNNKKLLIIDLVDTLVRVRHETFNDSVVEEVISELENNYSLVIENTHMQIQLRPGLLKFLNNIKELYYILVFTSSTKKYAEPILNFIDPNNKIFKYRLYQNYCTKIQIMKEFYFIKDLRVLNQYNELEDKIVCVDDDVMTFAYNLDNGVPIVNFSTNSSCYNLEDDDELMHLEKFLVQLYETKDVRKEITKRRKNAFEDKLRKMSDLAECLK